MAYNYGTPEDQTINPYGNPSSTANSFRVVGNSSAANATQREFVNSLEFECSHGYGTSGADKVTSYRSFIADQGSSDAWVDNALLNHVTDDPINGHVAEIDYNMITTRVYGAALGSAGGLASPSAWGIAVSGVSTQGGTTTGAYLAAGVTPLFQRGYVAAQGIIQSGFEDVSQAQVAFRDCGSHIHGLDTTTGSYSGFAVNIAAGQKIGAQTAARDLYTMMMLDGSNNLLLGTDLSRSATNVLIDSPFLPVNDNTGQLGGASNRFASVWAVNGTIQTSDPKLKTDMTPVDGDAALRIVDAIDPITFRWTVGGYEKATRTERKAVPVTETVELPGTEIEVVEGVAKVTGDAVTIERPVYDEYPMVGDDGKPLFVGAGDRKTPLLHRVARTEERDVEVEYLAPRPGKRLHWGWNADQVASAFAAEHLDFGGYIEDDDGTKALRPDQLIPVLWSAVRELRAQIAQLQK